MSKRSHISWISLPFVELSFKSFATTYIYTCVTDAVEPAPPMYPWHSSFEYHRIAYKHLPLAIVTCSEHHTERARSARVHGVHGQPQQMTDSSWWTNTPTSSPLVETWNLFYTYQRFSVGLSLRCYTVTSSLTQSVIVFFCSLTHFRIPYKSFLELLSK